MVESVAESAVGSAVGADPRFWSKVARTSECWHWLGYRDGQGYGKVMRDGRNQMAHRYAWTMLHGPIPVAMVIRHSCDNPECVRPDHLSVGTQADNIADRQRRGRHRPGRLLGEAHPAHKLADADVREIRRLRSDGWTIRSIARAYGISYSVAVDIIHRHSWGHVADEAE